MSLTDITPHSPMKIFNGAGSLPDQLMPSHQTPIVDVFFPGFSSIYAIMQETLVSNVDSCTWLLCISGILVFLVRYVYHYVKELVETYFSL
jgi:hypothetical protein